MRVAIIQDWLVEFGGAEKVLGELINLYPDADLFALYDFVPKNKRGFLHNKNVKTSFLQKMPLAKKIYRSYLPLMPIAVEQFDFSSYDLVISSSSAVAKGIITGPDQLHISYVHSPIRYAWDMTHQYLEQTGHNKGLKGIITKMILHYIRMWDYRTGANPDLMIGNSNFIARRIDKVYRRKAEVIYPPVDVDKFELKTEKDNFYMTASRLVPYKKIDLIVEAFAQMPDKKLVVIGDGPEYDKIKAKATPNIRLLGYQSDQSLKDYLGRAKAFVFAAEEDFGILPLEAQACGTPVIAFGKGGALETVKKDITGIFFYAQTVPAIVEAVSNFEITAAFDPYAIRAHAEQFSVATFHRKISRTIEDEILKHPTLAQKYYQTIPKKVVERRRSIKLEWASPDIPVEI